MKYIYSFLLLLIGSVSYSQNYTRDAGMRLGDGTFFTYRQFFSDEVAMEGMLGISDKGLRIVGLREYFKPALSHKSDNLKFMYGYGVHAGISYTNKYKVLGRTYRHDWMWAPRFGIDGLVGFDYTSSDLPFMMSVAMQPFFEYSINQFFRIEPLNFAFLIKYRF